MPRAVLLGVRSCEVPAGPEAARLPAPGGLPSSPSLGRRGELAMPSGGGLSPGEGLVMRSNCL